MTSKKMLYVRSDDFWGYDSSEFDAALNFYTYTWVVPKAMYEDMDESDQSRLFPCALFYVQGVTDNHNFLTLSVDVDGEVAKVKGMQGAKRRTRTFEVGVPFSYQVGSLTMKEAPAGSENIGEVEEAVKDGSATSEGTFIISQFLTDADSIAEAVGLTTAAEAEGFVSPLEVPATPSEFEPQSSATNPMEESYSAEEISDAYPQESAQTGGESSGRGVPVAYGSGSSQNLEPPVVVDEEMAAEELSDFYPQSSAEVGGVASGRGVPISYGSGSSQNVEPPTIEDMEAEEVSDFYPQSSAEIGGEASGRGVPVSYGSGSSQNVEPPVVVDDDYMDFEATGEPDEPYDQGYDDELDESLGMRDGPERDFEQSKKDRRDESKGMTKAWGERPYSSVDTMDAETAIVETGLPVIPDSYGNDSATEMSGRGVPVWYGSAEFTQEGLGRSGVSGYVTFDGEIMRCMVCRKAARQAYGPESDPFFSCGEQLCMVEAEMMQKGTPLEVRAEQGYDDRDDESIGMRHRGSYKQSLKDRRDESKGMEKSLGHRPYSDVETMDADWQHGRRGAGGRFRNKREVRNEVFGESVANEMRGYWRTGIVGTEPVVGDDVARSNDAKRFNYFSKPAVYNENTRSWSKGPNYRQAHKIAKGVAWRQVEKLGLAAEAEVLVAESRFDKLADKIAAQYEKKGKSAKEAMRIGQATAYKIGAEKYGRQGMAALARAGRRRANMAAEDYGYDEIPANSDDTNPMAYARLGAYDYPIIPNSTGGDSAGGSGYGVPQWYGADSFEGDRMIDNFEEAAPPRLPVKGIVAAIIGLGIGVWYAKK
jgi:hypothetical protein